MRRRVAGSTLYGVVDGRSGSYRWLNYLISIGTLEPGNYLITVSW